MEQYLNELKSVVKGQILSDEPSLEHYSKDGSVFRMKPWAVVLPSSKNDVVTLVKWLKEKKEELKKADVKGGDPQTLDSKLSVTCRGKGTDQSGGPINEGIILRFPGYLDKILEIGSDFIRVEPGVLWKDVLAELEKIGRFVPPYPASKNFATIGGGVANNCSGEKTVKYGSMREYVIALRVVLSDGNEREFKFIDSSELEKKQAQGDLEGEIYRRLTDLLISNYNLIQNSRPNVNKISSGYWLYDVLSGEGADLTKIFCGDQGTLGIITEVVLKTVPKPPFTGLMLASFDDLRRVGEAVTRVVDFGPSAFELVDRFVLEMIKAEKPEADDLFERAPAAVLLIEFEGESEAAVRSLIGNVKKSLLDLTVDFKEAFDSKEQNRLWEIRRSAAVIAERAQGAEKALPFIEDSTVHPKHLADYLKNIYRIMGKYGLKFAVWGHAGNGNLHLQPFLDLGKPADREKLFKVADEVYSEVINLRGALSGEHNDGLMRSPYLKNVFGEPLYEIFNKVKNTFDPLNIFNPYKKVGVDMEFVKKHIRDEYFIEIAQPVSPT